MYPNMEQNMGGERRQRGSGNEGRARRTHGWARGPRRGLYRGRGPGMRPGMHHRVGRGNFAWVQFTLIVTFLLLFRFALYLVPLLLIVAATWFAVRYFRHEAGMTGPMMPWRGAEKRKRGFDAYPGADDGGKPKNRPTRYYVGDDGELVELPPDEEPGHYV